MPAIDIGQIRGETAELVRLFGNPDGFALATREFFGAHSLPTLKQSPIVSLHSPLKTLGTPAPVLRTLVGSLRRWAIANPAHTQTVCERLWRDAVREQRLLAIELLGLTVSALPDEAEVIMLKWLVQLDDLELVDRLGSDVCGPWILGEVYHRLEKARMWINSPHKYQRQFGVMAMSSLAKNRGFRDISAVLNVLTGVMREKDIEVRKSVAHTLKDLSSNGPGEVAHFLGDWADTLDKNTNWIVRHAMERLDTDARTHITSALRGGAKDGIN